MPVSDDEMYRQLGEDYRHHLRWREKLFAGFLVVMGALALAFYHTHKESETGKLWFTFGWVIPLTGATLSCVFSVLDRRCHEVLLDRRAVGRAFEERAARVGLFGSMTRVGRRATRITHTCALQALYLSGAVLLFVVFWIDFWRLGGWKMVADTWQWSVGHFCWELK